MHLSSSQVGSNSILTRSGIYNQSCKVVPQLNIHFLSLEARIMVIEKYLFRLDQIEKLRSGMVKIA